MTERSRVLLVDDDARMLEMLRTRLERRGYQCQSASSGDHAQELLRTWDADVVITDLNMPGSTGLDLCVALRESRPDLPVVLLTAFGSFETAVAAIRAGAYDFVTKPVDVEALALAIERATERRALKAEVRRLRDVLDVVTSPGGIVGRSQVMTDLYALVHRVAKTDATVLISGESGTGKELIARALHQASARSSAPYVGVNCAALPETLLESELFGHARGAFTDARAERQGLFQRASGGTLLLDEIGDLPLALQPKLLRVLQERVIRPVGSDKEIPVDVRIMAATHRDLRAEVRAGRFREDLYYRIDVVHLEIPPLRARGNDILLLAQHFLDAAAARGRKPMVAIDDGAAQALVSYAWPGNVRELQNVIERAVALARGDRLTLDDLPDHLRPSARASAAPVGDDVDVPIDLPSLEEVERGHIMRTLRAVGGNKRLAARILGLDRKTLYRKLKLYGVEADEGES